MYPHRRNELTSYQKWIINLFKWARSPSVVLDIDRACRRAVLGDQTLSLDDKDSWAAVNFRFFAQGVGEGNASGSYQGGQQRSNMRRPPSRNLGLDPEVCKRWNKGKCNGVSCRYVTSVADAGVTTQGGPPYFLLLAHHRLWIESRNPIGPLAVSR